MGMITKLKAMTHKKMHYFPHLHTGVEKANRVDRFVLVGKFYILFDVFLTMSDQMNILCCLLIFKFKPNERIRNRLCNFSVS